MAQDSSNSESLSTAFHEAGHVLIHEIFGRPYTDVSVAEVGKEGVNYSYPDPQKDSPAIEKLIYACICYAGAIAEDKFNFLPDVAKEELGRTIAYGVMSLDSDLAKFKNLHLPQGSYEKVQEVVSNMVIENWKTVSTIAQALYEKKHITSENIKLLLDQTGFISNRDFYVQQLKNLQEALEI